MAAAMKPSVQKRVSHVTSELATATAGMGVDKHTVARTNVFILGQMLKGEADRQIHQQQSKPGAPVIALTKATHTENGAHGLPVRQLLSEMYHVERHKRLGEVLIFAIFFAVFLVIAFQLYDVGVAYKSNAALEDLFLDEEIAGAPYKKNFYEIMTQEEIFDWLQGPLLGGAYPTESYTGRELSLIEQQFILGYFRVVGGIRLRQARVSNSSCKSRRLLEQCEARVDALGQTSRPGGVENCIGRFDNLDGTCFAEFRASGSLVELAQGATEETHPFVRNGHTYTWSSGLPQLDGLYGWFQSYGTGGYLVELPTNASEASSLIAQLREDHWLDRSSRALEVAMNLYNTNTRLLTVVRIMFEMFPTGHVLRWARIYSVPAIQYRSVQDRLRAGVELIFVLFVGYYIQKGCRRICRDRAGGLVNAAARPNTLFELALSALAIVMVVQWFRFFTSPKIANFDVNMVGYQDMYEEAENFILTLSWAGMVGLGSSFRLFQFLSISKRMNTMWLTIRHGLADILAFGVSFALVIVGFALWGEMSFGSFLVDFRTFLGSISSLARFTLGAWNYEELRVARPAFAGVFFSLYSALMTISLVNMIIGIIETSFSEVLDELETADRWKENTQPVEAACIQRTRVGCSLCCRRVCGRALMRGDSDIRTERLIAARDRFHSALHVCMRKAKKEGTNLFEHLDKIYDEDKRNDALYISWHELASLLYKDQIFTPTFLHFRGSAARSLSISNNAQVLSPLQAAAGTHAGATVSDKPPAVPKGGGAAKAAAILGVSQQQQAAEQLHAIRAAEARATVDELVRIVRQEVEDQPMSRADASVINDSDELDIPDEECGPCLWRGLFCMCSTGSTSHGRRPMCIPCVEVFCRGGKASTRATLPAMSGGRGGRERAGSRHSFSSSGGGGSHGIERGGWRELRMLVKTYIELRRVHFVSAARRHMRAKEEQDAREKAAMEVIKRSNGVETIRKLVVDEQRGELLSFDSRDNLCKRLPLSQLVAVDKTSLDEPAIALVFTSQGVPSTHESRFGGLELVFDIKFASTAVMRQFYEDLWQAASRFHDKLLIMSRLMVERPAEAAMMLAKQGVQAAHDKVNAVATRARSAKRLVFESNKANSATPKVSRAKMALRRVVTAKAALRALASRPRTSSTPSPTAGQGSKGLFQSLAKAAVKQHGQQSDKGPVVATPGLAKPLKPPPPARGTTASNQGRQSQPSSSSSAARSGKHDAKQAPPQDFFG